MVIPEVGFEVTPTSPTMRDETVTKKKAKIAIISAASARTTSESMKPRIPGTTVSTSRISTRMISSVRNERSRSVRCAALATPLLIWLKPSLNDSIIVGIERISVIKSARGHRPGADVAHVAVPDVVGRHVRGSTSRFPERTAAPGRRPTS